MEAGLIKITPLLCALFIVFAGCSKDDDGPKHEPVVYVAGTDGGGMVWKNGERSLPLQNATFRAVFVSGNDVYVAGHQSNGTHEVAKVWKNGQLYQTLTDGLEHAQAWMVFISGGDVYTTGWENESDKGEVHAKVWKNGSLLWTLGIHANSYAIQVVGNDVYTAGYEYLPDLDQTRAMVWKNGDPLWILTDHHVTPDASANSIFVSGNDVYVVGMEFHSSRSIGRIWKNGVSLQVLYDGTGQVNLNSVFVSGNDVFVAGTEGSNSSTKVWKNGVPYAIELTTNESVAQSVFALGKDVYVAGSEYNGTKWVAKVWKNGSIHQTLSDGTNNAAAYAMFVE